MSENQVASFTPVTVTAETLSLLSRQKGYANLLALYMACVEMTVWQGGNNIKASRSFMMKRLGWGEDRLSKAKSTLVNLGLLENLTRKNEDGTVAGHYILVKYVIQNPLKPSAGFEHGLDSEGTSTNKVKLNTNKSKKGAGLTEEDKDSLISFGGLEEPSALPPSLNGSLNSEPRICPFHKKTGEPGYNCRDCGTNQRAVNSSTSLLQKLINIVNPREKVTDDRLRNLNARLKDYSEDEIISAAGAFAKSEWHKENGQMSIDNLIRASKFGRWYAEGMKERPPTDKSLEKFREEEEQELKDFREGKGKWASPSN